MSSPRRTPTRRALLGALTISGVGLLTGCGRTGTPRQTGTVQTPRPPATAPIRYSYGADASQWAELYRPAATTTPAGTAIVIHGGFWRAQYGAELGAPLAADLSRRGWTAWNVEYRRVGIGGGWPNTLADVAAAIDYLPLITPALNLGRVVAIGHSAGGQLATWAAHRGKLAAGVPGAHPRLEPGAVICQAGVLDLVTAARTGVGGSAVGDLLGGSPDEVPDRYRDASPQAQLPLRVPVRCVHSRADENVPYSQSVNYVAAARAAGADADLIEVPGDHMSLIDPGSVAWHAVLGLLKDWAH